MGRIDVYRGSLAYPDLGRRDFLELFSKGSLAVTMAWLAANLGLNKEFTAAEPAINTLLDEGGFQLLLGLTHKTANASAVMEAYYQQGRKKLSVNKNVKILADHIATAVGNYSHETKKTATYDFFPQREQDAIILQKFGQLGVLEEIRAMNNVQLFGLTANPEELARLKFKTADEVVKLFPNELAARVVQASIYDFTRGYWDVVRSGGSGFGRDFLEAAQKYKIPVNFVCEEVPAATERLAKEVVNKREEKIEIRLKRCGKPAPFSEALTQCLIDDKGRLEIALRTLGVYTKKVARVDRKGNFIDKDETGRAEVVAYATNLWDDDMSYRGGKWGGTENINEQFEHIGIYHLFDSFSLLPYTGRLFTRMQWLNAISADMPWLRLANELWQMQNYDKAMAMVYAMPKLGEGANFDF